MILVIKKRIGASSLKKHLGFLSPSCQTLFRQEKAATQVFQSSELEKQC
jgi:hypothetical protein